MAGSYTLTIQVATPQLDPLSPGHVAITVTGPDGSIYAGFGPQPRTGIFGSNVDANERFNVQFVPTGASPTIENSNYSNVLNDQSYATFSTSIDESQAASAIAKIGDLAASPPVYDFTVCTTVANEITQAAGLGNIIPYAPGTAYNILTNISGALAANPAATGYLQIGPTSEAPVVMTPIPQGLQNSGLQQDYALPGQGFNTPREMLGVVGNFGGQPGPVQTFLSTQPNPAASADLAQNWSQLIGVSPSANAVPYYQQTVTDLQMAAGWSDGTSGMLQIGLANPDVTPFGEVGGYYNPNTFNGTDSVFDTGTQAVPNYYIPTNDASSTDSYQQQLREYGFVLPTYTNPGTSLPDLTSRPQTPQPVDTAPVPDAAPAPDGTSSPGNVTYDQSNPVGYAPFVPYPTPDLEDNLRLMPDKRSNLDGTAGFAANFDQGAWNVFLPSQNLPHPDGLPFPGLNQGFGIDPVTGMPSFNGWRGPIGIAPFAPHQPAAPGGPFDWLQPNLLDKIGGLAPGRGFGPLPSPIGRGVGAPLFSPQGLDFAGTQAWPSMSSPDGTGTLDIYNDTVPPLPYLPSDPFGGGLMPVGALGAPQPYPPAAGGVFSAPPPQTQMTPQPFPATPSSPFSVPVPPALLPLAQHFFPEWLDTNNTQASPSAGTPNDAGVQPNPGGSAGADLGLISAGQLTPQPFPAAPAFDVPIPEALQPLLRLFSL